MEKAKISKKSPKKTSSPARKKKAVKPRALASRKAPASKPAGSKATGAKAVKRPKGSSRLSTQAFLNTGMLGGVLLVAAAMWTVTRKHEAPVAPVSAPQAAPAQVAQAAPAQVAQVAPPAAVAQAPVQEAPPAAPTAAPQAPAPVAKSSGLALEFEVASRLALDERVVHWSRYLSGAPDVRAALRSLGSGPDIADSAPLVPSKFDCTTFVETVLALSRSGSPDAFYRNLIAIRYRDATPGFITRNHFPEADWIPNNARAGVIADITESVAKSAGFEPDFASKTIDRGAWLAARKRSGGASRALASVEQEALDKWSVPVDVRLGYIPVARVRDGAINIPNGSVINFIHQLDGRKPVLITHQGFVVREGGKTLLRHSSPGGHIQTVGLEDYLRGNSRVVGINLNRLAL